ncbi:hypothetical protein ILYODFUR_020442 [Ilyodon furcidens]|uniref:Uncharacterized protein n=1 Tax=Ilyodon furcidens TaxID=33524 RepID=A0ABV0T0X3_9TELE
MCRFVQSNQSEKDINLRNIQEAHGNSGGAAEIHRAALGENPSVRLSWFSVLSLLLHHTIPTGTNLRLTVYQCITRLHLSNLQPHLPLCPGEGPEDQGKGKE